MEEKKEIRVFDCPQCDKTFTSISEYSKHRLEECPKTTDENRENIRKSLEQLGLLE